MTASQYDRLLVAFHKQPVFTLAKRSSKKQYVRIDSTEYYQVTDYDWTGFFDWLRSPTGNVIGVRYSPFEEFRFVFKAICDVSDVLVTDKLSIEVYFGDNRDVDPENSSDQDFGKNEVYTSTDGKVLIAFGTSHLNEDELQTLQGVAKMKEI